MAKAEAWAFSEGYDRVNARFAEALAPLIGLAPVYLFAAGIFLLGIRLILK